jgi:hypothetical protein
MAVSAAVHARCATRKDFQALVDTWGNVRPAGQRLIHRATDRAMPGLSSSSPLQTRYVPVGYMWFEGFSRLAAAGVALPGLLAPGAPAGDAARVALEGYPGLLAYELIGRTSYKNSEAPDRLLARKSIVEMLEQGRTRLNLRLKLTPAQAGDLVADASGDRLDAVLCLMQAAWAAEQRRRRPALKPRPEPAHRPPMTPDDWFASRGWQPFEFQRRVWAAMARGESGLLHATTGSGKTLAVWMGALLRGRTQPAPGLQVLWLTPMRALAADTTRALTEPLGAVAPAWRVGQRTGDTPAAECPRRWSRRRNR